LSPIEIAGADKGGHSGRNQALDWPSFSDPPTDVRGGYRQGLDPKEKNRSAGPEESLDIARLPNRGHADRVFGHQDRPGRPEAGSRPGRDDENALAEHAAPFPPGLDLAKGVGSQDEKQPGGRHLLPDFRQGMDRVGRSRRTDLQRAGAESLRPPDGGLDHCQAGGGRSHIGTALVRRNARGNEKHAVQFEARSNGRGRLKMAVMDGIEGPPEDSDSPSGGHL